MSELLCKGSIALGSACMTCKRCLEQLKAQPQESAAGLDSPGAKEVNEDPLADLKKELSETVAKHVSNRLAEINMSRETFTEYMNMPWNLNDTEKLLNGDLLISSLLVHRLAVILGLNENDLYEDAK